MKKTLFGLFLTAAVVLGPVARPAAQAAPPAPTPLVPVASSVALWQRIGAQGAKSSLGEPLVAVREGSYDVFALDEGALGATLANAPDEFATYAKTEDYRMELPMPDGTTQSFRIWESSIMEPALAAEHPEIRTYLGQGVDDPTATARFDRTPLGFHAQIIAASGTVYVDPYRAGDTSTYVSYDKRGLRTAGRQFSCLVDDDVARVGRDLDADKTAPARVELTNGGTLRTYRLALACTGEYATAVCNHNGVSVTVANTFAAMTTSMNRVDGVYERELSIRMVLVANDTSIVYTNSSTDPYTNSNANSLLTQNQSTCDSVIGSANYDIGHVFSTGGGGLAGLGVVCSSSRKAQGETGSSAPYGDGYDIDYVAHEMGHEFGGDHTFISTMGSCSGNGNASTAYERGSGSTIMAYAGICGSDDLQPHSDDYFHGISLQEIVTYTQSSTGNTCAVQTSTGNTAPSLTIGPSYTAVPEGTPFTLTAQSASDPNGDTLTYCWEDWQTGSANKFRPRPPTTSPSRTIPQISDVLAGSNSTTWETTTGNAGTTKTFRCTVRDNRAGGGGFTNNTMTVAFVSGAFSVTAPNTAVSWAGGSSQTVTWAKGGSTAASVNILLSTNGGSTWTTVVSGTANDGSEAITVPNTPSTTARIKVEAAGNIYFDVSNVNFTITSGSPTPDFSLSASPSSVTAAQNTSATSTISTSVVNGFSGSVALSASGVPSGASAAFSPTSIAGAGSSTLTLAAGTAAAGTYSVTVTGTSGSLVHTTAVSFTVTGGGGGCSSSTTAITSSATGALATTDCTTTAGNGSAGGYYDDFTFSGTSGQAATITLNSTAFDAYLRLYDAGGTQVATDDDSNGGTNSKITYTLASSGTFKIRATSYAVGSTGSYTVALTLTGGGGGSTVLSEGAESGATGWTVTTNVTGNNWVVSPNGRYTGSNGFRTNNATSTYVNNLDQSLVSPAFSLAGKSTASLTYRSKRQTESGYDFFRVEISTNGGSTWTSLSSLSGSSTGFTTTAGSGMVSTTLSLNSYAGQANVKIRFRLTSDVSVTQWGAAVDDITVTAQ